MDAVRIAGGKCGASFQLATQQQRKLETCATFPHRQTARKITLEPLKSQIDDTIELCRERVEKKERVLVTTLTKCTAKDLAGYLI